MPQKAAKIVREEMDAIGCAEVLLPTLQPFELWQQTGRDVSYGENLMRLKDRHGRQIVLGPTHEEVVTELVKAHVSSYKQLPLSLYQIQTKFRDEYRPRFGLLRVREFIMKDAYSFHATLESLNEVYDKFYAAYEKIFTRCGIPFVVVEAESGPIGGSASHEFMAACAAGEDTLVTSDKGNYAANVEVPQRVNLLVRRVERSSFLETEEVAALGIWASFIDELALFEPKRRRNSSRNLSQI